MDNSTKLQQANRLLQENNFADARQLIREIIQSEPDNVDAWYLASYATNTPRVQIQALERVLQISPDYPGAALRLADIRARAGQVEESPATPTPAAPPRPSLVEQAGKLWSASRTSFLSLSRDVRLAIGIGAALIATLLCGWILLSGIRSIQEAAVHEAKEQEIIAANLTLVAHSFETANAPTPTATPIGTLPPSATPTERPTGTNTPLPSSTPTEPPLSGSVTQIPYHVIDAAYSPLLDAMILISEQPDQLHIHNPITHDDVTIGLPRKPTTVGVSPDGMYAAVGHDGRVTYINLQEQQIVAVLNITVSATNVVLTGGDWVYVEPSRLVKISTNEEAQVSTVTEQMYVTNRAGTLMYSATLFGSSTIFAFDIASFGPKFTERTDSYYDSDNGCGGIALSGDETKLYTYCGTILRINPTAPKELIYDGSFEYDYWFNAIASAPSRKRVVTGISNDPLVRYYSDEIPSQVIVWDDISYNALATFELPNFVLEGSEFAPIVQDVFMMSDESRYFVLMQAPQEMELTNDFGYIEGGF